MFYQSYLKQYKYHIIGSISLLVLFSIYKRFSNDIPSLSLPEKNKKEKEISEEILNENKQLRKMLLLLTKELQKSTESIQKLNKNMEIKENSLDFQKKYFIKDIEKRYILIDSTGKSINGNTSNNVFSLDQLSDSFKNIIGFRFIRSCIPLHIYNIHSNNNILKIKKDGIIYTITLDKGKYTISELAVQLRTKLKAGGSWDPALGDGLGFNVTLSDTTFLFTITRQDTTYLFQIESSPGMSHLLGLENINEGGSFRFGTDPYTSFTSTSIPQTTHQYIDLVVPEIPSIVCKYNSNVKKSVLERINLNGQSGDFIYYNSHDNHHHTQNYFYPISLSSISIELYDEWGNLYDCGNMHNFFEFEITILKNSSLMMDSKVKPNIQSSLPN